MSTKDQRTINMVHYPLGDSTNPQELGEYLDSIDTATAAKIGGTVGSTDNRIPRSDGTGGLTLQATGITVDDSNNMSGVVALSATSLALTTDLPISEGGTGQSTATAAFDALAPTTTQGDIIYHNGTDNVRLGAGTSGQFLQTQGAGANPQWATGAVAIVAAGTLSNVASIDIAVSSVYDMYEFDLINFLTASGNQVLRMRFSQSGSYLSGASDYFWAYQSAGVAAVDEADSEMEINSAADGTNEGCTTTVRVFRPGASSFQKSALWYGFGRSTAPASFAISGGGGLAANTNAIDGVQFLFAGAGVNIASGYYAVRGYKFT